MSNIFKANSRFSILSEDKNDDKKKNEKKKDLKNENLKNEKKNNNLKNENLKEVPKINSFKDDRPRYENRPRYNDRPRPSDNLFSKKLSDKAEQERKEDESKKRDAELEKVLSIDNFPELSKNTNTNIIETPNFLEKIKKEKKIVQIVKKKKEIPYGWTLITYDKKRNKSYIKYNEQYLEDEQNKKEEEEERMIPFMVLDALANLHSKRKEKYINEWGYDEYEKMFISPNYDPEYFDKLDAKYEEEMEKIREQEYAQEESNSE
jgi:hypothetical protein